MFVWYLFSLSRLLSCMQYSHRFELWDFPDSIWHKLKTKRLRTLDGAGEKPQTFRGGGKINLSVASSLEKGPPTATGGTQWATCRSWDHPEIGAEKSYRVGFTGGRNEDSRHRIPPLE